MQRVALISGGSRGIGHAVAVDLQRAGYALSLGLRRPDSLPPELAGPSTLVVPYDASDRRGEQVWVDATVARFGRIDAVVNNAGTWTHVGLEDGSDADLDVLFEVNVKAPFRVIRAAWPFLKASGTGRVVNVASLSGKRVRGLNAGYQMSKHAVMALTHSVRRLGWEHGIRATALCPGYVNTDMAADIGAMAPEDMTQPEDLARLVTHVIALPNTAAIAELLVNCDYEHTL
jgi:NAD(P)-dependent dehydrogenase (short-subunit alcohol dehydrogenase family)